MEYDKVPLEQLLAPVSADAPSGDDLVTDDDYRDLLRKAKGRPEKTELAPNPPGSPEPFSRRVIPAEDPAWEEIRDAAVGVIKRGHDLVALGWYTVALLKLYGFAGLADGLGSVRFACEQRWATLFPQLDPRNEYPAHRRARAIGELAAPLSTRDSYEFRLLKRLRETPLVSSRNVGEFSLASIMMASQKLTPPPGVEAPSMATIEAAWTDADEAQLAHTRKAIEEARGHLAAIGAVFAAAGPADQAPKLTELDALLADALKHVVAAVQRKSGGASAEELTPRSDGTAAGSGPAGSSPGPRSGAIPTSVQSRADVQRALDAILAFYDADEERKASPVWLFVKTARNLMGRRYTDLYTVLDKTVMDSVKSWAEMDFDAKPESERT